jgi:hypothetical protein
LVLVEDVVGRTPNGTQAFNKLSKVVAPQRSPQHQGQFPDLLRETGIQEPGTDEGKDVCIAGLIA